MTPVAMNPPGPRGHFLLGNLSDMKNHPLEFMTRCARTYGDVVYLKVAGIPVYLINHPDLIEHVLVTDNRNFIKPKLLRAAGEVLGNGLLTSEGDFWLRQRRLMQPAFHRDRIVAYGDAMTERTSRMLDRWSDGATYDIHREMMRLTLAIVADTLFGVDVEHRAPEVGEALEVALERFVDRMGLMRMLDRLPLPRNIRFRRAQRRLDEIIFGIIHERRGAGEDSGDLISMLLRAQDDDGAGMTDQQLRDEAITLFLAGHETTAIALSWTFHLLAGHPEVEDRLVDELRRVLGGRPPSAADLPDLRYTDMVMRESMRLHPPAWRVGREAVSGCRIGEYDVPAGAQVVMSQWVVHRDPRFWDDPEAFRPGRWEEERIASLPKFAYFPFGGGARRCIGDAFATMEAVLLLAGVMQRAHLAAAPGPAIGYWPSITLRPTPGIPMTVSLR